MKTLTWPKTKTLKSKRMSQKINNRPRSITKLRKLIHLNQVRFLYFIFLMLLKNLNGCVWLGVFNRLQCFWTLFPKKRKKKRKIFGQSECIIKRVSNRIKNSSSYQSLKFWNSNFFFTSVTLKIFRVIKWRSEILEGQRGWEWQTVSNQKCFFTRLEGLQNLRTWARYAQTYISPLGRLVFQRSRSDGPYSHRLLRCYGYYGLRWRVWICQKLGQRNYESGASKSEN